VDYFQSTLVAHFWSFITMLSAGVTAVMTFAAFMLSAYLGLKARWLLAAISLFCFFALLRPRIILTHYVA
jgi:hypothetical protein